MTSILYNKKIKYILILAIFSIVLVTNSSYSIVSQTRDFYVNDSANLLSDETEDYIINMNKTLEEQTGAQIVVVTVQNLEGQSLEEYATELFRDYGIGDKEKNNGVLLLCAYEERQFRIEVGYGLEGTLTDGKTGRIQDEYIIPYLKENNFNNGIRNGFNAVLKEVENEYGITLITTDEVFRKRIEPGSAPLKERLDSLRALHDAGCKTWVSIEPFPTPNIVRQDLHLLLEEVRFVDRIIFGRMNYSTEVTAYTQHKQFFNDRAAEVIAFCNERGISCHIKDGTITE